MQVRLHHHLIWFYNYICLVHCTDVTTASYPPLSLQYCTLLSLASYSSTSLFLSCFSSSTRSVRESTCDTSAQREKDGSCSGEFRAIKERRGCLKVCSVPQWAWTVLPTPCSVNVGHGELLSTKCLHSQLRTPCNHTKADIASFACYPRNVNNLDTCQCYCENVTPLK